MSAIHWSIVLAKIDLVSLYFRLLWYHSILKGSIDQYSKIHSPLACSRWLPWFPDLSRPYVACVKRGSGETYVRSQSLSSESAVKSIRTSVPRRAKKDSNIPSPGRTRLVKSPIPGPTKTIKSPPHALLPASAPPAGFTLIGALRVADDPPNIWTRENREQIQLVRVRAGPSTDVDRPISIIGGTSNLLEQSQWLWRWLPHRLSKRQSPSTTTVLFKTTFTRMIMLNLLLIEHTMLYPETSERIDHRLEEILW